MSQTVKIDVTEGNDVWFAHRITLPSQQYLENAASAKSNGTALSGDIITVDLIRDSATGSTRRVKHIATITDTAAVADYVFNTLQYTFWDGYDDIGYNFLFRLTESGTNGDETWKLEGGNNYYIEFSVATQNYGTIRWANKIYVTGLISR